jgi:transcriptional regulator with XRE-family HTH domain
MDVAGVDVGQVRRKTRRVPTDAEKRRLGLELKKLRDQRGWDQRDIPAKGGPSVGTVQHIEYGRPNVRLENLEKYALVFNTTTEKLLHPELALVVPPDPLFADLHRDYLEIARRYMMAITEVRKAVELLLTAAAPTDSFIEEVADVVLALQRTREITRDSQVAYWVTILLDRGRLVRDLARRLDHDSSFEETLLTLLDDDPPGGPV